MLQWEIVGDYVILGKKHVKASMELYQVKMKFRWYKQGQVTTT